jgi:ferritin-like metal-binding protein YciE
MATNQLENSRVSGPEISNMIAEGGPVSPEMAKITTMEELFLNEIRGLYDAEQQLIQALPKVAEAASSDELRYLIGVHLEQTGHQVQRLERIFAALGEKPGGKKCAAMTGLIREANEMIGASGETAVRVAGLISAARKVEHYEISGYESARMLAEFLGNNKAVRLLDETLFEEQETDERLNDLVHSLIGEDLAGNGRPKTRAAGWSSGNEP